jgi:hypothetical protein
MRWVAIVLGVVLALGVLALAAPRLISAVVRLPGDAAVELAVGGDSLRAASSLRAIESREASIAVQPDRRTLVELGILYNERAIQAPEDSPEQRELYGRSLDAFQESLTFSPVQPMAWLVVTQIAQDQDDAETAAEALDWSILTSGFLLGAARPRTLSGLELWDRLREETRVALMDSVVTTLEQEPELVARVAVDAMVSDDIEARLRSREESGNRLAAQFRAAIRRNRHRLETTIAEESVDMGRLLAASAVILTTSISSFAEAMTVEQYLAITRDQVPGQPPESVIPYLTGTLDGLLMLSQFNAEEGAALFCMPPEEMANIDLGAFKLTLDAMLEQFERELPDFHELARTRSVGLAVLDMMATLYPCDG